MRANRSTPSTRARSPACAPVTTSWRRPRGGNARDSKGRITSRTETINGVQTTSGYQYSADGQLWKACSDLACSTPINTYLYDADGNRQYVNGSLVATYDQQDRLLTYNNNAYTFTAGGDLASSNAGAYSYDLLGNLRSVTPAGGITALYAIDGDQHRVQKKYTSESSTYLQGFLYNQRGFPVAELTLTNPSSASTLYSVFAYGLSPNVPELLMTGGSVYRLIKDAVGSVRLVVNVATGAIAQQLNYDEFGNTTVVTDTRPPTANTPAPGSAPYFLTQPFGFAGGVYDKYAGLTRFGARDYDAVTGRWTSKDPIRFRGGDESVRIRW